MIRITSLSEDYGLNIQPLRDRGVSTVDDLWACIGKDVDLGITKVVDQTQIGRHILLAFLIVDTLEDPRRSHKPHPFGLWLGLKPLIADLKKLAISIKVQTHNRKASWSKLKELKYGFYLLWLGPKWLRGRWQTAWGTRGSLWPDLLLIALPLLVVALAVRAQSMKQSVVERVAVQSGVGLPAFEAIDTHNLILRRVINQPGTFASVDELKQRYPSKDLTSGEIVNDQQLLPSNMSSMLVGRYVVSLPIKSAQIQVSNPPLYGVKLMLTPRDKEKSGVVIDDVILLAIKRENETTFVTVAVADAAVTSMQSLVGISDIYVLEPAR